MHREQNQVKSVFQLPKRYKLLKWLPSLFALVLLVLIFVALIYRQDLIDKYNVYSYKPSSEITNISSDAQFSNLGQFYFYASLPEVNDSLEFNENCARQEATSVILGCYVGQRIYIYDVKNDQKLAGVKTVTAAHEMLHAVWERLSGEEKDWLAPRLQAAYDKLKTDELVDRMEYYSTNEPGEEIQELHSILATEFADLGSELEQYYSKYFSDRQALVAIYEQYSTVIAALNEQMNTLKSEINSLSSELVKAVSEYNSEAISVNNEVVQLESDRSAVDTTNYSTVASFNTKRSNIISHIQALNIKREAILSKQKVYIDKIEQYNSLVLTGNKIRSSLDSTLEEAPNVTE